ncbi:MAG: prepilin-type N-terminal cleavage/methylation domain-containing protein [Gammaproteobacteria bacterium]|nr:prepilin-type N-terminal cleavage/methylation domain-containing protein [Gammaproteobacteria bacterium]
MKQKGFTLIELVVVIIILGILAVTALPKFVNLQGEARASTLQGMKAALEGAATLTYSKAAIQGKDAGDQVVDLSATTTVATVNGYPEATTAALQAVLETTFGDDTDINAQDWWAEIETATAPATADSVVIRPKGYAAATGDCSVTYTESAAAGSRPVIVVAADDC